MADAWDFQIETMKFRMATSDNFPYVRGTAPFRKEQFDSAPTVGDQSLTGWWTRGQLSFHMGAGLKYYEVLEGETVLNRFQESSGVDVFTPGVAKLDVAATQWVTLPSTTSVRSVVPGADITGATYDAYAVMDDGASMDQWLYGISGYPGTSGTRTKIALVDGKNAGTMAAGQSKLYVRGFDLSGTGDKIERFDLKTGTSEGAIYLHTPAYIDKIWFAKDRLWVLDRDGKLYAVTTNPSGALPASLGTPVFTFPFGTNPVYEESVYPSLAEYGSGVLFSRASNLIYQITLSTDGSVPTLTAPRVAAALPSGESIRCMREALGLIVLVTTKGVRVAQVNGNGDLIYGPPFLEWDRAYSVQIGVVGARVYVNGGTLPDAYEIDLTSPSTDNPLVFPYRKIWVYPTNTVSQVGAVEMHGYPCFFAKQFLQTPYRCQNLVTSGSLTTGYHRFGTLDPKRFQRVLVRTSGDGGTITVYRIDANGTAVSVGTMSAVDGSASFDLGLTTAVERIALKFTLTRSTGDLWAGPTLLGYQLKALPVPERQRILKVPLTLADDLTLRRGTRAGHRGKAYEDMIALETLESSQAVVTFTDHRTGETGSAYIDSVDFQGDTPSSENTNGFGGVAYVTLRVLS